MSGAAGKRGKGKGKGKGEGKTGESSPVAELESFGWFSSAAPEPLVRQRDPGQFVLVGRPLGLWPTPLVRYAIQFLLVLIEGRYVSRVKTKKPAHKGGLSAEDQLMARCQDLILLPLHDRGRLTREVMLRFADHVLSTVLVTEVAIPLTQAHATACVGLFTGRKADLNAMYYPEWEWYTGGGPTVPEAGKIATHLVLLGLVPIDPLRLRIMPAGGDLERLEADGPMEAHDPLDLSWRPSTADAVDDKSTGVKRRRFALDDAAGDGKWLVDSGDDGDSSDVEVAASGKGDPDIAHITTAQFEAYAKMLAAKKKAGGGGSSGNGKPSGEFPKPPKQKMTAAQAKAQKRKEKVLSQQARVEHGAALARARQAQEAASRARSHLQGGRGAGANAAALQAAKGHAMQRSVQRSATGAGGGMGSAPQQAPLPTVGGPQLPQQPVQQQQQQPHAGQLQLTPEL